MDGMLSQEEINALLSGMDLDDEPANAVDATSDAGASEELLTPEEKDGESVRENKFHILNLTAVSIYHVMIFTIFLPKIIKM